MFDYFGIVAYTKVDFSILDKCKHKKTNVQLTHEKFINKKNVICEASAIKKEEKDYLAVVCVIIHYIYSLVLIILDIFICFYFTFVYAINLY